VKCSLKPRGEAFVVHAGYPVQLVRDTLKKRLKRDENGEKSASKVQSRCLQNSQILQKHVGKLCMSIAGPGTKHYFQKLAELLFSFCNVLRYFCFPFTETLEV
jgi:hypothetical protein